MKPLNLDNRPCSPISSNCVIWQGPDIPCIKLCTGDTISDVVYKLATELCTIMDELNVSNYDLTCLGITACPPQDFQALIQLLITKICELSGITPTETKSSGCPDCVVSVAPCFVEGNQTTMQLVEYVQMIANKVCSILSEIQLINDSIINLVNITNDLQFQIDNLPVYELPKVTLSCPIGPYGSGTQVSLDTLVGTFLNTVWCPFYTATGTTTELLAAVAQKCILDSTLQLSTGTTYGTNPNWIGDANYNTVADAINNIWVVLCDMFNYLSESFPTTVVDAGEGITVTSTTVGSTTTYTVENDYLETFVATTLITSSRQPINGDIPKQTPGSVNGLEDSQIMYKFNSIASNNILVTATATPGAWVTNALIPPCSFGAFDNDTTGEFSISVAGTYLINVAIQLKSDNGSTTYWQTSGTGAFGLGILANGNNLYTGNYETVVESLQKQISISGSIAVYLTAGSIIRMGALNLTDRDYNGNGYSSGDIMRFGITKLR